MARRRKRSGVVALAPTGPWQFLMVVWGLLGVLAWDAGVPGWMMWPWLVVVVALAVPSTREARRRG